MCAGLVFSLVIISQSCSVFLSCDISTVTVLIRGSIELPCCFVVWQCVCTAKEHVSDHLRELHYHLILTRGTGAVLAAVERVSGLLYLSGTNVDLFVIDHRVAKRRPRRRLVSSNTQWVRFRDCWEDRSASQDVKTKGIIGVSSMVQHLRQCLITQACG